MGVELVLLSRVCHRGVEVTGGRLRNLLALLAADPHAGCGAARLVAELWPDNQPEHPAKALQVLVSRARARLGADAIANTATGYRLTLADEKIDTSAVLLHASAAERHARAGDHAAALADADAGLALCTGAAWDDPPDDPLARLRSARRPAHRALRRARALALSRLGRRAEAIAPLTDAAHEHPRDEEILAELLRCEAAVMGPATALARYDAYRTALRDDLGSDPGTALQDVHADLLRGDLPTVRYGVLHEPNPLLGRDEDVAAVAALLRTARVTSVVGAGGLGKTRLVHAVCRVAEQRLVHFVGLAGVTEDADVAGEVAAALGVGEATGVMSVLGPGPALLVLDNCEHVVRGAADLVGTLVANHGELRVLTTSRAPLGISSEAVYPLPELTSDASVELFEQRARAARPGVALPRDAVRALCAQLDGLPLAVELAAARVRVMSVDEIARRLDDRFALLRGGARDAPERHHTLHAVIDGSWQLLEPVARAAMRALSIFPGGFGADAARYVVGADDVLPVLEQLVDQSLLRVTDTEAGTRYRMVESVREFSATHRDDAHETDAVVDRFLLWAKDFGMARHESVFTADLIAFAGDARTEQDNLVQALRYGLDRPDGAAVAAASAVLAGLWIIESNFARSADFADETGWALSHYRPEPAFVDVTRTALALCAVCTFLILGRPPLRALAALRRFPPAPEDTPGGAIQTVLCTVTEDFGALRALTENTEPLVAGLASSVASFLLETDNDLDGALRAARGMLAVFDEHGSPWMRAVAHARVGELCLRIGSGDAALHHMTVALAAVEKLGAWTSVTRVRWAIVLATMQRGKVDETERVLAEVEQVAEDDSAGMPMFDVAVRAEIDLARGEVDAGLRGWRQAAARLRTGDDPLLGLWPLEVQAVCVVAHAQHGRVHLVTDVVAPLAATLARLAGDPATPPVRYPASGIALLAVALADTGDPRLTARMVALAERLRYVRDFLPTMSADRIRQAAVLADESAYADAVAAYADLDHAGLRAALLELLAERDRLTGSDPGRTATAPTGNRPAPTRHTTPPR
ncbi:MAG TPA: BTAD domain-containing putative transcriptional regulator [Pseudonocardiaceae bacterium]|nr:BTAD domain-containing putative transcriptional regulator [Pseudonocardiaceae bacterium]